MRFVSIARTTGTLLFASGLLTVPWGCESRTPPTHQRGGRPVYDRSQLDAAALNADSKVRRHVLYMPFGEAAARLGSLQFDARSKMVFSRGNEKLEQEDVYNVTQDSRGNFHVVLQTPRSQVEVYLVGETLYVREDKGRLRHKPRRDIETGSWCETAFSSLHEALEVFQPRLALGDGRPESLGGRQVVRYPLGLSKTNPESPPPAEVSLPRTSLPVPPPARWRELARPLDLKGSLVVDTATGVVLRLSLEGNVEIADREVRPTELTLKYDAAVKEIGKVASVAPPASVDEYRRIPAPQDPVDFFRDHLPAQQQEADESP